MDTKQKADAALIAKQNLLASVSHELRTPLHGVIGTADILENGDLTAGQRGLISTMRESALSLNSLIDSLLDAAKFSSGGTEMSYSTVRLLDLVEGTMKTIWPIAGSKKVGVRFYYNPALPEWITTDEGRLRHSLLYLLDNAIKFSPHEMTPKLGIIELSVDFDDQKNLRLSVADNGIGLSDFMKERIFQPFVQGESGPKRKFGGIGLGLSNVAETVQKLDGTITVESAPNERTEFAITLPLKGSHGELRKPDLKDVNVVSLAFPDGVELTDSLGLYLKHAGANPVHADTEKDLFRIIEELAGNCIVVLADLDVDAVLDRRNEIAKRFPDLPVIRLSYLREDNFGWQSPTYGVIRWSPVLLSEFWDAVETAVRGGQPIQEITLGSDFDTQAGSSARYRPTSETSAVAETKGKVLLVEDNLLNQDILSTQLSALGFNMRIEDDGQRGLIAFKEETFDLVLSDYHMPVMNGLEMTRKIRESELQGGITTPIPIVVLSADTGSEAREGSLEAGESFFQTKPLRISELEKLISECLPQNPENT